MTSGRHDQPGYPKGSVSYIGDSQSPRHYSVYPIAPIQITSQLDFCLGNVVKYVLRAPFKNGVEDIKKAKIYLDWAGKEKPFSLNTVAAGYARLLADHIDHSIGARGWEKIATELAAFLFRLSDLLTSCFDSPLILAAYVSSLEAILGKTGKIDPDSIVFCPGA